MTARPWPISRLKSLGSFGALVLIFAALLFSSQLALAQFTQRGPNSVADVAELVDWNWQPEPTFAGTGAILWDVEVRNTSSRDIRLVMVKFFTYDADGNFVGSDSRPVISIPPGQTRVAKGYGDLYGTEATATVQMVDVVFATETSAPPLDSEWERRVLADRKVIHFCRPDRALKDKLAITAGNLKRRWPNDPDCRDAYEEYVCAQDVMNDIGGKMDAFFDRCKQQGATNDLCQQSWAASQSPKMPAAMERCSHLTYHH